MLPLYLLLPYCLIFNRLYILESTFCQLFRHLVRLMPLRHHRTVSDKPVEVLSTVADAVAHDPSAVRVI